jgi:ribosomal protein S18 acetylase RimI-like enzyme
MIKTRKATKKDLKQLLDIYIEGTSDERKLQFPNETNTQLTKQLTNERHKAKILFQKELNERSRYWPVVEINGKIVGYGQAYIREGASGIGRVYVKRGFRRQGIGKMLMNHLLDYLKKKKVKEIESYVYTKNKPSLTLHKQLGFRPESYRMVKRIK